MASVYEYIGKLVCVGVLVWLAHSLGVWYHPSYAASSLCVVLAVSDILAVCPGILACSLFTLFNQLYASAMHVWHATSIACMNACAGL